MKPYAAVQGLARCDEAGKPIAIIGSCFRVLQAKNRFITASHCIEDLDIDEIKIFNPLADYDMRICGIYRHQEADIAVLATDEDIPEEFEKFAMAEYDFYYGAPTHCFGMVCDYGGHSHITARVIGGIVQRDFVYNDGTYKSAALEISVPIPRCMSGGPAFDPNTDAPCIAFGVAIASIQSETIVHSMVEFDNGAVKEIEKVSRIIEYGVVLRLYPFKDWLREVLTEK